MSLLTHAKREFQAAGWADAEGNIEEPMQRDICNHVLTLLEVFSAEGHSGSSAPYAIDLFKKLASFEPLVPLSGDDSEWNDVGDGRYQNNRCSHVFKDKDRFGGQAYDIDGIIFYDNYVDEEGKPYKSYYTSRDSAVPITFPYTPKREYKERP